MARALVAGCMFACLVLGVNWYRAAGAAAAAQERLDKAEKLLEEARGRLREAGAPQSSSTPAGKTAPGRPLTEEEQLAALLVAARMDDFDARFKALESEIAQERRLRERAENAAKTSERGRTEALAKCDGYLKREQGLLRERDQLRQDLERAVVALTRLQTRNERDRR